MKTSFRRTAPLLLVGIGLLFTFCGSATAAHLFTGKQIQDGSIASVDLRDAGISGADVQDRSLTAADLDHLVTPGGTGAPGLPVVPREPPEPRGQAESPGSPGSAASPSSRDPGSSSPTRRATGKPSTAPRA